MSRLTGRWADARSILCIRLDAMGDVVMTTPAIRALAESAPEARLTLLTSTGAADVARLIPQLDAVLTYTAPWMKAARTDDPTTDLAFIEELRAQRFDAAVIFTVHSQSALPAALMCQLAGIPLRLAHVRENPYLLLTDWTPDPEPIAPVRHETRRQLDLVASIGATTADEHLSLRVPDAASRAVRELLASEGIGGGAWAVLHPGASAASRRYPPERWAEVARRLVERDGWRIVFTGGPEETELIAAIRARMGRASQATDDLAGRLSLAEMLALLAIAPVLVSNNTGPVHLAAAVGTPVVDLYALTNLQHAPWGVPSRVLFHDVPCKGCRKSVCPLGHNACLALVDPADVANAAVGLVSDVAAGRVRPSPELVAVA